ncbi:MAG: PhoU domain-containing protein [Acidimicrobiales bacterium]|nr:PhoU domain-containing protein [Acidimicrobiales bacterium]
MVLSFFRRGESGMESVTTKVVRMLSDARHSFDLATATLVGGVDPADVRDEIYETDQRINRTEQELRRELVVHVSVQGPDDIGDVLGHILLIKKIERIGDQAKNIFDLATEGVSLADAPDAAGFIEDHQTISNMIDELAALLADHNVERVAEFRTTADAMRIEQERHIRMLMHSDEPGHWAVPRAVLHRYLKRIVANLAGVATTVSEPVQYQDYYDEGRTDITDD